MWLTLTLDQYRSDALYPAEEETGREPHRQTVSLSIKKFLEKSNPLIFKQEYQSEFQSEKVSLAQVVHHVAYSHSCSSPLTKTIKSWLYLVGSKIFWSVEVPAAKPDY